MLGFAALGCLALGCSGERAGCVATRTCESDSGAAGAPGAFGSAPGCDPAADDCEDVVVIHVSPHGSDRNDGALDEPVRTIRHALALGAAWHERGATASLHVCSTLGGYAEALVLDARHAGISVVGGYSCQDFSRADELARISAPQARGHRIEGATGVLLADVALSALDASAPGESSVTLSVVHTEGVRVVRSELRAGRGGDGASAADFDEPAAPGVDGLDQREACFLGELTLVASVTWCGDEESVGGLGGPSGTSAAPAGASGSSGEPGAPGGAGATESIQCTSGTDGASGEEGDAGAGAPALGRLDEGGYRPSVGEAGTPGGMGFAGGGGGGDYSSPAGCGGRTVGGSGGSGGCGGSGGNAGRSGGGSFALLSIESALQLEEVNLIVSEGGKGGDGGAGQPGGAASLGGLGSNTHGPNGGGGTVCNGGRGGRGGMGGPGGGGSGGPAIGIAFTRQRPELTEVLVQLPDAPAAPGLGGGADSASVGSDGVVAKEEEF